MSRKKHRNGTLRTKLRNQVALREILLFNEKPHNRSRISRRNRIMLLLVTFHQQGEEFDCIQFRARGAFDRRELEESVGISLKFRVVVYDVGSAVRDHFCRVRENFAHFVPNLLSQLLRLLYCLWVKKDRT